MDEMQNEVVLLGSLLVITGAVAPATIFGTGSGDIGPVTGHAVFSEANYTGTSTVESQEAMVRLTGDVSAQVQASKATVHVYEQEQIDARPSAGDEKPGGRVRQAVETSSEHRVYRNVSLEIDGDPDGSLRLWPNETLGSANFTLPLDPAEPPKIVPSPFSTQLITADQRYEYDLEAPVFALGPEMWRGIPFESSGFEDPQASGEMDLIVQRGQVEIQTDGERTTLEAEDQEQASDPTGTSETRHRSYIAITVQEAHLSLDPSTSDMYFLGHEPEWRINGSVEFDARDGEFQTTNRSWELDNDTFRIKGNTSLALTSIGRNDELEPTDPVGDYRLKRDVVPDPRMSATFTGDPEKVSVNGDPVPVAESPTIPEEVTFWGKIVGLLLLAFSVVKKFGGFLVALFVDDPLDNDRRREIFDYLQDVGMAHMRAIHRATDIPVASLTHHLETLQNAGLVTKIDKNGYTVYFVIDGELSQEERRRLALLADETRCQIARVLLDRGKVSQAEIASELCLSQGAISKQMKKMRDACLIEEGEGWPKEYQPSSLVRRWLTTR